jgi:hypothetical protein
MEFNESEYIIPSRAENYRGVEGPIRTTIGETAKLKRQESVSVTRTLEHSQKSLTRSQARATQAILLQANAVSGAVGPAPSSG